MGMSRRSAKYDENVVKLVRDIIVTYKLLSPTVVVGDKVPKLCLERQWVLCISHSEGDGNAELARHLAMLNKNRKQDSVIFVGAEDHGGLLKVG